MECCDALATRLRVTFGDTLSVMHHILNNTLQYQHHYKQLLSRKLYAIFLLQNNLFKTIVKKTSWKKMIELNADMKLWNLSQIYSFTNSVFFFRGVTASMLHSFVKNIWFRTKYQIIFHQAWNKRKLINAFELQKKSLFWCILLENFAKPAFDGSKGKLIKMGTHCCAAETSREYLFKIQTILSERYN